ncbi:MAG: hypothetical protein NT007_03025 [Candidatus Kapabacteria bacterium]|nr:hypothetical protein [Candidatus Kapabacteria bacterium]
MNRFLILVLIIILNSCQLLVIGGSHKPKPIDLDQKSAIGAVLLFKLELDSNNIPAATGLLASPQGRRYLAIEKYELYDEVARLGRKIAKRNITFFKTDTLSISTCNIVLELNYSKSMSFTTSKINEEWYIVSYRD